MGISRVLGTSLDRTAFTIHSFVSAPSCFDGVIFTRTGVHIRRPSHSIFDIPGRSGIGFTSTLCVYPSAAEHTAVGCHGAASEDSLPLPFIRIRLGNILDPLLQSVVLVDEITDEMTTPMKFSLIPQSQHKNAVTLVKSGLFSSPHVSQPRSCRIVAHSLLCALLGHHLSPLGTVTQTRMGVFGRGLSPPSPKSKRSPSRLFASSPVRTPVDLSARRTVGDSAMQQLVAFASALSLWELVELQPQPSQPSAWSFDAALLFVDISGFTNLCTKLSVDALQVHINQYFTRLISVGAYRWICTPPPHRRTTRLPSAPWVRTPTG